jgi:hypothetical protein
MTEPILSFDVIEQGARHSVLRFFNRGAISGDLVVWSEDVEPIRRILARGELAGEWLRGGQPVEYEVEGDDVIVQTPAVREYTVRARLTSEKAVPHSVELEEGIVETIREDEVEP